MEMLWEVLRCPATGQRLTPDGARLVTEDGTRSYPLRGAIPILIADDLGLFRQEDYATAAPVSEPSAIDRWTSAVLRFPSVSRNWLGERNFAQLHALIRERAATRARPRVLIIGGAIVGQGIGPILGDAGLDIVETDVAIGPRTSVVCDAQDLPFADGSFDAVIIQAVLCYLPEPQRAADEIHRVLSADGLVYSEAPFMQQVLGGAHDYFRFSMLGHRRLFHHFEQIDAGAQCGPGMATAWSVSYLFRSFGGSNRVARGALRKVGALLTFWLTFLDPWLIRTPGGLDAASGVYFLGRRTDSALSERELSQTYQGGNRSAIVEANGPRVGG
ncbi:MAG: hypothetical protein QOK49_1704 [Baekduia sp.]|jgi:uncharacterized protein YbaR (Trm112 family)|nr:hypothetical protein [Baekduia sp.]